ncbi:MULTISPECIES: V-type ATP synthase subunit D [Methanohalophilus]|jgi:V/A-type H+-transporting ATPase subunit D|uniref:A-type ATP synthase subunit D n=1 Tax=Methanohalophilus euhalobius TaxID=51203 RepID=A0A285EY52_9EURY|nr:MULTISPECIES: V-type ATP synthase subunit D [Methanohalophilus]KXS46137.1 MAG: V-type H+-transporting ATPase subunit D [Methanohalophilus sp. T328-1]RSD34609.1 MAG: V-type H+-transporting ATPase subunit D [Methanohalophilus sp.]OBZ36006.1 MAG: V-type ATP synthase subunit D [Methanohalophilus sp. DAL1]ODV50636.1 MAG: V-type H+-transporting ATPase subunit D [Methanohalophilus sp. 2-GBenrich]PQV43659.1 V/A-type H+-transporting ATPase subunit D [Methanohalophilus euhalobius]
MGTKDVKPTRSELIELKKKIKLSQSGHKLLKMKRDGLILEFFEILNKAKGVRNELDDAYDNATEKIGIAEAVEGRMVIKSTALALKDGPEISLESHNIMGVVVPKIEASSVHKPINKRGYGILGTSSYIDETVDSYEILVDKIILAAEIETTMKRLLDDIEKTKRRVNALEFKVIPEMQEAMDFIRFRLDEMERENTFRLKRIKA